MDNTDPVRSKCKSLNVMKSHCVGFGHKLKSDSRSSVVCSLSSVKEDSVLQSGVSDTFSVEADFVFQSEMLEIFCSQSGLPTDRRLWEF